MKSLQCLVAVLLATGCYSQTGLPSACVASSRPEATNTTTGWIASPNYPSNYDDNLECQWLITSAQANEIVTVRFTDFETETGYDRVIMYDGDTTSATFIAQLSGTPALTFNYTTTQTRMLLRFTTDNGYTFRGFNATYWSTPVATPPPPPNITLPMACDASYRPEVINGTTGWIASPNHPMNYYNDLDCRWLVAAASANEIVILRFQTFNVENPYDSLIIYDGNSDSAPVIVSLTGIPDINVSYRTTQRHMFLKFLTDGIVTRPGFNATWTIQWADQLDPCSNSSVCIIGRKMPNPDNCTTYYDCDVSQRWRLYQCLAGTLFDKNVLACVAPNQATCQSPCPDLTLTTTTPIAPGLCDNVSPLCQGVERQPDRSSCNYYYQCRNGNYTRVQCSPPIFVYNIDTQQCQAQDGTVDCSYRCRTPAPTSDSNLLSTTATNTTMTAAPTLTGQPNSTTSSTWWWTTATTFTAQNGTSTITAQPNSTTSSTLWWTTTVTSSQPPGAPSIDPKPYVAVKLNGTMTATGSITQSCSDAFSADFRNSFQEVVGRANNLVATGQLCSDGGGPLRIVAGQIQSLFIGTSGQTVFSILVGTNPPDWVTLQTDESCSWQVSDFVRNGNNWRQPIISNIFGCPAISVDTNSFIWQQSFWDIF